MFRIDKAIKPWKEAAALNDHINLYGFWNETTFITKSGDIGVILRIPGVDYECLDQEEQERAVSRLEAALKSFGVGFHVYQYLFKTNHPTIPFGQFDDPLIRTAVEQRREFFSRKSSRLFQIEIFYAIVLEGTRSKQGFLPALKLLPSDPAGALRELKAQFTSNAMKVLLKTEIAADAKKLEQSVRMFAQQMREFTPVETLSTDEQFTFFRRLLNFDKWRVEGKPNPDQYLDFQVVNSNIEAERDHLRVGDHFVRLFSMKDFITATKPMVLDQLLKIPHSFYAVSEWTPVENDKGKKAVESRRNHFNSTKGKMGGQGSDPSKSLERDVIIDEGKQADLETLGKCLRELSDGHSLGKYSFTLVLYDTDKAAMDKQVGEFAGIFTDKSGTLFAETYNQLNVYFATIPGNYAMNLRKLHILNTNYADLSFLFTIHPGEQWNKHFNAEYLAVLESANDTPYYLNLHNRDVAHTLILGMTGSGKSFFCNFLLASSQKYKPFTFIFDMKDSFESVTSIYGGVYVRVGKDSPSSPTINPFSLEPTQENLQFLFSFFRVLMEGKGAPLIFSEERSLFEAIENMYSVPKSQRTLSTLYSIIGPLKDRLHRWTRAGQYGYLFDNVNDTLTFARFQTFNFGSLSKVPDILEPLLFYVLHRTSAQITSPANAGVFKTFLLDEAWIFILNETIRKYVEEGQRAWRSHGAAMILATQSVNELEDSGMLKIVSESCPTKIFLANPDMDRTLYSERFHLNDTEMKIISELLPPGQMLIRKAQTSKKVQLNVDSLTYWTATSNSTDNVLKREYFERYGIKQGLRRLAIDHPKDSDLLLTQKPTEDTTETN